MEAILEPRYRYVGLNSPSQFGYCKFCNNKSIRRCQDQATNEYVYVCKACFALHGYDWDVPFPIRIEFQKNLKNSLGMGNQWIKRSPSREFFNGISSNPMRKERIDFSKHYLYMSLERAKKEGIEYRRV